MANPEHVRITALQIQNWADQRRAQEQLPTLVRQLISSTCHATKLSMPGGESVGEPGLDGEVIAPHGNAWVPQGLSYWEMGCSGSPATKANSDYNKRTQSTDHAVAKDVTFVFVTPRKWRDKDSWAKKKSEDGVWGAVNALDADDLEAWLEIAPRPAIWLGSLLGIVGTGVETPESYFRNWTHQSEPAIQAASLLAGRDASIKQFHEALSSNQRTVYVKADSQGEAAAFACSQLIGENHGSAAICVTSESGWVFVDQNPNLRYIIVSDNELLSTRAPTDKHTVIAPLAIGASTSFHDGHSEITGKRASSNTVHLKRTSSANFQRALVELGWGSSDANRMAKALGRSWTAYRRACSSNPAIRKPLWLDKHYKRTLVTVTLLGAWDGNSNGDRQLLEAITQQSYEDIEEQLIELLQKDDSPILRVGNTWKAKAPLDLLILLATEVPSAFLERYINAIGNIFQSHDPQLDLPDDKRWLAHLYDKHRPQSSTLLSSISDSLAMLAWFSDREANCPDFSTKIRRLVHNILSEAEEQRWLACAPFLRSLAEAAPEEFLDAAESSMRNAGQPITALIRETSASFPFGTCWHAHLLWALELLAWSPQHFKRVAFLLADLAAIDIAGNWANTPFESLVSIFRAWMPQTSASPELRKRILRELVDKRPELGWKLLLKLIPSDGESATPNERPNWRDDARDTERAITVAEYRDVVMDNAACLIDYASGDATRISQLIGLITAVDESFQNHVLELVRSGVDFNDVGKETLRDSVRKFMSWHNSFNKEGDRDGRSIVDEFAELFDRLAPQSPTIRHTWLFENGHVSLPRGMMDDHEAEDRERTQLRTDAIREVYSSEGWEGVRALAIRCRDPRLVGWAMSELELARSDTLHLLCDEFVAEGCELPNSVFSGYLHAVAASAPRDALTEAKKAIMQYSQDGVTIARFLSHAPARPTTWDVIDDLDEEIQTAYWEHAPIFLLPKDETRWAYCVNNLLLVHRPRTALHATCGAPHKCPPHLLNKILEGILLGQESEEMEVRGWDVRKAIDALAATGDFDRAQLAQFEFWFFQLLQAHSQKFPHLTEELLNSPKLLLDLICLVYKPRNSDAGSDEAADENTMLAAHQVLRSIDGLPGRKADGSFDEGAFEQWLRDAKAIAVERDRKEITDFFIGRIMGDWPIGKDLDIWPPAAIANFIDDNASRELQSGFCEGCFNKRGVVTRAVGADGTEEREIAAKFARYSEYWIGSHPNVSSVIGEIVEQLESEARRNDQEASWREEV